MKRVQLRLSRFTEPDVRHRGEPVPQRWLSAGSVKPGFPRSFERRYYLEVTSS